MKIKDNVTIYNFNEEELRKMYHYIEKCNGENEFENLVEDRKSKADEKIRKYTLKIADGKECYYKIWEEVISLEENEKIRNSCDCKFCYVEYVFKTYSWYNILKYLILLFYIEHLLMCFSGCSSDCINTDLRNLDQRDIDNYRKKNN